ncbi:DUF5615 family PIN-like protein [Leptolyngbya sp. KIOST-1]|uniref:DUF5615 family PIN-like protein n=1 Tax=Leptolyngbya sp. KIOST-1 TaxID=1229172 RepID=UPI00298E7517|nr:DUF5615 family PIN-like protein [Leptolyngbya sp. KIOST-1]
MTIKTRAEMLRLLADENFNNQIVRGILRRKPEIDIVRVQDVNLSETDDRVILEWAAQQGRVLLTHDVETMTRYAYERVQAGLAMPGVFEISRNAPVGLAIEEILLITEGSLEGEWERGVWRRPAARSGG